MSKLSVHSTLFGAAPTDYNTANLLWNSLALGLFIKKPVAEVPLVDASTNERGLNHLLSWERQPELRASWPRHRDF